MEFGKFKFGSLKSSMGPRVLTVRALAGTGGASDDSLSPDQGTEAAAFRVGSDWRSTAKRSNGR